MKKNLLTKVLIALLVVLLAIVVVACKPKSGGGGGGGGGNDGPTDKAATLDDIITLAERLIPLAEQVDLIEDEIHVDVTLALSYDQNQYQLRVQGDIYSDDHTDNQIAIVLKEIGSTSNTIKLGAYLKNDVIYLNQSLTSTHGLTKFSNLDGVKLSKKLSELPGFIAEQNLNIKGILTKLRTDFGDIGLVDGVLSETKALTFKETSTEYILGIEPAGLGDLVSGLSFLFADGFGDYQGIVNFALDFIFGVDSFDELQEADPKNFPTIKITAFKDGKDAAGKDAVNGLRIYYKGDLDKATTAQEELSIGITANVDSKKALTGDRAISFPNFDQYKEGVVKASLSVDLGVKDLFLKADIYGNPSFKESAKPQAYLAAFNKDGTKIADLDALYDGEKLYFDLAGLYTMLSVPTEGVNTQYSIDFDFFDLDYFKPADPANAAGEGDGEEEGGVRFMLNPNFLADVLVVNINELIDIVKDILLNQKLEITVKNVLRMGEKLLVFKQEPVYSEDKDETIPQLEALLAVHAEGYVATNTYTATEITAFAKSILNERISTKVDLTEYINGPTKKPNDQTKKDKARASVYDLLDKLNRPPLYTKSDMIEDLNKLLAPFADDYDAEETYTPTQLRDLAKSVIKEFSGVDLSVDNIINATSGAGVDVKLALIEDALGIELSIKANNVSVLNLKVELDVVAKADNFVLPAKTAADYEGAIDLNLEQADGVDNYNIYFDDEGKKCYVILDELTKLLDAYRAYTAAA